MEKERDGGEGVEKVREMKREIESDGEKLIELDRDKQRWREREREHAYEITMAMDRSL